jgi:hypothetical protein
MIQGSGTQEDIVDVTNQCKFSRIFAFETVSGTPISTSGNTYKLEIRSGYGQSGKRIYRNNNLTKADNTVLVEVPLATMITIPAGRYQYAITQTETANAANVIQIMFGNFIVIEGIVRYE